VEREGAGSVTHSPLPVSLTGRAFPASSFLPFSACTNGRKQSQTASVALTLPNSTISAGPTSLTAGDSGTYTGSTSGGDTLNRNFDGGAAPVTGNSGSPTIHAARQLTARLQATKAQNLAASAMDTGNLVSVQRDFSSGDPTPATRALAVAMPPNVDYENFETAQVHPLRLSNSGNQLYAVNT